MNINKPAGWTSHDVVLKVRELLKEKRIGHTGTLDPMATGVLVLCVGKATRIAQYLEAGEKEYDVVMRLGITTDTLDAEGRVLEKRDYSSPDAATLIQVMDRFTGTILQRPPVFSAVKVSGVPSYKLARQGRAEQLKPRKVTISDIVLAGYDDPLVALHVRCSKGTYIRALCADMGEALGTGAHLARLVRRRSGRFRLEDSLTVEQLSYLAGSGNVEKELIPLDAALSELPAITIYEEFEARKILHGNEVACSVCRETRPEGLVRIHDGSGKLLAVARANDGKFRPEMVFLNE